MIYHRSGNISTAVEIFSPRWKYYHRGRNILTAVEILSPRWKYYHRGGNIITAVDKVVQRTLLLREGIKQKTHPLQGSSKWSGWSGYGRTNNRAGNFKKIYLIL